ncbi:MAG: hypothetical protein FWC42_05585 [Proteobacteria bacterium]|nr:hypothetical protein [Pseudomonadota bacterium]
MAAALLAINLHEMRNSGESPGWRPSRPYLSYSAKNAVVAGAVNRGVLASRKGVKKFLSPAYARGRRLQTPAAFAELPPLHPASDFFFAPSHENFFVLFAFFAVKSCFWFTIPALRPDS